MRRQSRRGDNANSLFQLALLILVIGLVGLLVYRQVQRISGARRPVVVAREHLAAGTMIGPEHIELARARSGNKAGQTLNNVFSAVGQRLMRPKVKGEPLLAEDLGAAGEKSLVQLSNVIPEGRVLTTLTLENTTVPHKDLVRGDRVDILVSGLTQDRKRTARIVVNDAYVLGFLSPSRPVNSRSKNLLGVDLDSSSRNQPQGNSVLLLALRPEDVLPVAQIDGPAPTLIWCCIAGPPSSGGEMLSIESPSGPRLKTIEVIVGSTREEVTVQQ